MADITTYDHSNGKRGYVARITDYTPERGNAGIEREFEERTSWGPGRRRSNFEGLADGVYEADGQDGRLYYVIEGGALTEVSKDDALARVAADNNDG